MLDLTLFFLAVRLVMAQAFACWIGYWVIKGIRAFSEWWRNENWDARGISDNMQAILAVAILMTMILSSAALFIWFTWNNCVDIFTLLRAAFRWYGEALG